VDDWKIEPARDSGLVEAERWKSLRRESGLISTGIHIVCWSLIRTYLAVWHRLRIVGWDNVPSEPPFVLVANHTSHMDALVLASHLSWRLRDQVFPIAAGDVFFDQPVKSALSSMILNALPMWRKHCGPQALRELRQRLLAEPCAYILFPEGKRSRDGNLLPFKNGLGMLIAGTPVPVIPCHLQGCFDALRPGTWRPRNRPISLQVGSPLQFAEVSNSRSGWEQISDRIRNAVIELSSVKQ
jgi:1-acyl-sn-glycerol-3-phosphate acyltransferase